MVVVQTRIFSLSMILANGTLIVAIFYSKLQNVAVIIWDCSGMIVDFEGEEI